MSNKHPPSFILAIDQGTTSSRAIVYRTSQAPTPCLEPIASACAEFPQHYPENGWVEHQPNDLWQTAVDACKQALRHADIDAKQLVGIGITNQRETTLVWERASGTPVYPAIVWQDRRTAPMCKALRAEGHADLIHERTGLLLDPYFSATKIRWILDNVPGAQQQAERGELCFGTVDSYLLWRLTNGEVHATDASNASRTLLMNLASVTWDQDLLSLFKIPLSMLPDIHDNTSNFGHTCASILGHSVPILAMVGDQQGALIGQACVQPGMLKSTYGTGCFALLHTGTQPLHSAHRLLATLAYRIDGTAYYALEGSIFMAGAIIQWLRDSLGVLATAAQSETLAQDVPYSQSEVLIPAFTGLGAPYWDPDARAALFGMTRDTGPKQIAAAALKSVALQSHDLLNAMVEDGQQIHTLRVDGGMTENNWFLQALSDLTGYPVERAQISEATALGAAFLAALHADIFTSMDDMQTLHRINGTFEPKLSAAERSQLQQHWLAMVAKVR